MEIAGNLGGGHEARTKSDIVKDSSWVGKISGKVEELRVQGFQSLAKKKRDMGKGVGRCKREETHSKQGG